MECKCRVDARGAATAQVPESDHEDQESEPDEVTQEHEVGALLETLAAMTIADDAAAKPPLPVPDIGLYHHCPKVPGRAPTWKLHRGHAIRPCETHCGKQISLFRAGVLWPSQAIGLSSDDVVQRQRR